MALISQAGMLSDSAGMCHPAPGPRCSAHAYAEYIHALQAYEHSADAEDALRRGSILAAKQAAYDSTPRGQRALDRARQRETDFGKILELQKRLEDGRQLRKDQLAAYHTVADTKRSIVKSQLREEGIGGRYQHAAGIAYHYLLAHRHDLLVMIEQPDTISVDVDGEVYKVFVIPQKYQHAWGSAQQVAGRYVFPASESLQHVLNTEAATPSLSGAARSTVGNWFVDMLRDRGYTLFAGVNTLTEQVHVGLIDELIGFIEVDLRVQPKPRGTTAYRGDVRAVKHALRDTVFATGTITLGANGVGAYVDGVPQQARRDCTVGNFFLGWQAADNRFEVRVRHASAAVDVIVKAKHKRIDISDGVSTQAVAVLGGALV